MGSSSTGSRRVFRAWLALVGACFATIPAPAAAADLEQVEAPGGYLAAWLYLPGARRAPALTRLPSNARVSYSHDIKSRGFAPFWAQGGLAVAWIDATSTTDVRLSFGLPAGASVQIDGRTVHRAVGNEAAPRFRETAERLKPGRHRVDVHLPPMASRWDGQGFFFSATGKGLTFHLPADAPGAGDYATTRVSMNLAEQSIAATTSLAVNPPFARSRGALEVTDHRGGGGGNLCRLAAGGSCVARMALPSQFGSTPPTARLGGRQVGQLDFATTVPAARVPAWYTLREVSRRLPEGAVRRGQLELRLQQVADLARGKTDVHPHTRAEVLSAFEAWHRGEAVDDTLRAYRSPFDGRWQPYTLLAPKGKPAKVLIVGLHGHRGTPQRMCRAMLGGRDRRWLGSLPEGVALVCPYGYGDTAFRFVGEDDLFRVVRAAQAELGVTDSNVHLVGVSDGGLAALETGLHFPDRWASVSALASVGDMRAFPAIGSEGHTTFEGAWVRRVSAIDRASNSGGVPYILVYGANDRLPASHVEALADALREGGSHVELEVLSGHGHNVWTTTFRGGKFIERLVSMTVKPQPVVTYRSFTPRHDRAWGITFEREPASIWSGFSIEQDARQTRVTSDRLTALQGAFARQAVAIDGHRFELTGGAEARFEKRDGRWFKVKPEFIQVGPPWPDGRRGRGKASGPLDEFRAEPVTFVYGTRDPDHVLLYRYLAELEHRRFYRNVRVQTPVIPDTDVKLLDLRRRNLFMIGTPDAAPVMHLVTPGVDAQIAAHEGGYRGLHRNPLQPGLNVVVSSGDTARQVAAMSHLSEVLPARVWAVPGSAAPFGLMGHGAGHSHVETSY